MRERRSYCMAINTVDIHNDRERMHLDQIKITQNKNQKRAKQI